MIGTIPKNKNLEIWKIFINIITIYLLKTVFILIEEMKMVLDFRINPKIEAILLSLRKLRQLL